MNRSALVTLNAYAVLSVFVLSLISTSGSGDVSLPSRIGNKGEGQWFKLNLPEATLTDREGRSVALQNDVFAGKIVVIDFVYTSCTTACPLVSAIFSKLQQQFEQRSEENVRLVSLSLNPAVDTSARLKHYASRYDAGPDWFWLTGQKAEVDKLIEAFGVLSSDYASHPPVVLVGNTATGQWARLNGLASPNQIISKIDQLVAAK